MLAPASSIIKVSNLIIPEASRNLTEENFDDILVDIFSLFAPHAIVINGFIVRSYQFAIGGNPRTRLNKNNNLYFFIS